MQPLPADISPNDVHQWLGRGAFLVVQGDRPPRICTFREACFNGDSDDWEPGSLYVLSYDVETGSLVKAALSEVMVHWPLFGAVNVPPSEGTYPAVAWCVRRNARQHYTRTYTPRVVTISPVARWELARSGISPPTADALSPGILRALFFPQYPEYAEARAKLDSGEAYSVALSRHVSVLSEELGGYVCYGARPVGRLERGEFVPFSDSPEAARCERLLEKVL